jgi:catechol 2,3-dioxygenase-like lactoylglutathione lyase family enzyme
MSIKSLAFVMLGSADLDRSIAFYHELLQLPLNARFENFAFFDAGGLTLVLTGELARSNSGEEGCEVVFGVDSVRSAHSMLRNRITFINEPRPVNAQNWAVNFRDPDGHLLSLYGAR